MGQTGFHTSRGLPGRNTELAQLRPEGPDAVRDWTPSGIFAGTPWHFADDNVEMVTASSTTSAPATRVAFHREAAFAERVDPDRGPGIPRFLVVPLLLALSVLILPVSARQAAVSDPAARPCKVAGREPAGGKHPASQKNRNTEHAETNTGRACLELHSPALDLQEHLQSLVREKQWHISDEQIGESLWSFTLDLSREELLGYTKPDPAAGRVILTGGKAAVLVKTADLGDGYTRLTVSVHFEGYGEAEDTFAMKRASWKLSSSGRLESMLTDAWQTRFRADH
jgi:hypothetical protein